MARNKPCSQDWKESRRRRALVLKRKGWKQRASVDALGITKGAVSQWMSAVREQGDEALCRHPHLGAVAKLS